MIATSFQKKNGCDLADSLFVENMPVVFWIGYNYSL